MCVCVPVPLPQRWQSCCLCHNGEHYLDAVGFDTQRKSINRHQIHYLLQSIFVDGGRCIRKLFHGNHTTLPCHFLSLFK